MRFFSRTDPKETAVPDIASPDPMSAEARQPAQPTNRVDTNRVDAPPSDTGTRLGAPPQIEDDRADCPVCHGTGKTLTTADYLREIAGMLPDDEAATDAFIAEFYRRLVGDEQAGVKGAAPHLKEFFPPDLTTGDALNSKGNKQRDQLFGAIAGLLTKYDPDRPESDDMRYLSTALAKWGRDHAWWYQPSTGGVYVPTAEDYLTVRNVLVSLLREALGNQLTNRHVAELADAYETAEVTMRYHAKMWRMSNPGRVVMPRQPRRESTR
jgi:hypothetical protein